MSESSRQNKYDSQSQVYGEDHLMTTEVRKIAKRAEELSRLSDNQDEATFLIDLGDVPVPSDWYDLGKCYQNPTEVAILTWNNERGKTVAINLKGLHALTALHLETSFALEFDSEGRLLADSQFYIEPSVFKSFGHESLETDTHLSDGEVERFGLIEEAFKNDRSRPYGLGAKLSVNDITFLSNLIDNIK